ncbi:rhomboid family intramembrane serine protease [Bacillus sp. EAC]|uniref:rhomboid family intramembrane serine protease n=1 Tax=Bacillus sp. EAC TaxID=1978338 RepID=UPI000B44B8A7|nr:rhomboid family intramembrane serine protease [Bacillus sp. EAC]
MFLVTEDFKTFIKRYPVISIMVGICTILMILTAFSGGYSTANILKLGGYQHDLVNQGEYWRLFTYAFMHGSYAHFFMNMTFMIILGRPLERALGSFRLLVAYLVSALFTGIVMYFTYSSNIVSSGSSGVGYAYLGIYLYIILFRKNLLLTDDRKFILTFLAIGLISSFIIPNSSLIGHIAGMGIGFFITPLLLNKKSKFHHSYYA